MRSVIARRGRLACALLAAFMLAGCRSLAPAEVPTVTAKTLAEGAVWATLAHCAPICATLSGTTTVETTVGAGVHGEKENGVEGGVSAELKGVGVSGSRSQSRTRSAEGSLGMEIKSGAEAECQPWACAAIQAMIGKMVSGEQRPNPKERP
jgi:hypothetical protein